MRLLVLWVVTTLTITSFQVLIAQSTSSAAPPTSGHQTIPDQTLYFFLFDHISTQDTLATQQIAAGKNGNSIRNYYATAIGLTTPDFQLLHDTSVSCRSSVARQDQAAATVIKNFRAQAEAAHAAKTPLPPFPNQLVNMQQERNIALLGCVAQLQKSMTPQGFKKLDQFVHQEFVQHVSSTPIPVTPPGTTGQGHIVLKKGFH